MGKNKNNADVTLSPELIRIRVQAKKVLTLMKDKLHVTYFVLDGHFGNSCAASMVRQLDLHIISKPYGPHGLHHNAELYLQPTPEEKAERPRLKYGARIDYKHLPEDLQCWSSTENGCCTEMYQAQCLHKLLADPINVVVVVKTHLETQRVGHVVFFSSDLMLEPEKVVDYYVLRFQPYGPYGIEFTFRDAKQHFGLEDFMGVKETSVANAVGLSFFMVNLSRYLLDRLRIGHLDAGVNDLRSYYRGLHYVGEILKIVPEKPDPITWVQLVEHICRVGCIHPTRNKHRDLDIAA